MHTVEPGAACEAPWKCCKWLGARLHHLHLRRGGYASTTCSPDRQETREPPPIRSSANTLIGHGVETCTCSCKEVKCAIP